LHTLTQLSWDYPEFKGPIAIVQWLTALGSECSSSGGDNLRGQSQSDWTPERLSGVKSPKRLVP
jgi:hypothetical protein